MNFFMASLSDNCAISSDNGAITVLVVLFLGACIVGIRLSCNCTADYVSVGCVSSSSTLVSDPAASLAFVVHVFIIWLSDNLAIGAREDSSVPVGVLSTRK